MASTQDVATTRFLPVPTYNDNFTCAAWAVEKTEDEEKANCKWGYVSASSVTVLEWLTGPIVPALAAHPAVGPPPPATKQPAVPALAAQPAVGPPPPATKQPAVPTQQGSTKQVPKPKAAVEVAPQTPTPVVATPASQGKAAPALQPPKSFSIEGVFEVPVIVNHKQVAVGDVLLVHEPPVEKRKQTMEPVKTESLLKKMRT